MTAPLVITRVTHSCRLIQIGGMTVLTGPGSLSAPSATRATGRAVSEPLPLRRPWPCAISSATRMGFLEPAGCGHRAGLGGTEPA
jgi:L-ascorbate metabolism protein UlaG (beta-lactamase superfamily)